jgi:hypothetical protein
MKTNFLFINESNFRLLSLFLILLLDKVPTQLSLSNIRISLHLRLPLLPFLPKDETL